MASRTQNDDGSDHSSRIGYLFKPGADESLEEMRALGEGEDPDMRTD